MAAEKEKINFEKKIEDFLEVLEKLKKQVQEAPDELAAAIYIRSCQEASEDKFKELPSEELLEKLNSGADEILRLYNFHKNRYLALRDRNRI